MFRIVFLTIIIFIISIYRYSDEDQLDLLFDGSHSKTPQFEIQTPTEESANGTEERPTSGISTFIGNQIEFLVEEFGYPTRKDPTPYNFDWWIYNYDYSTYMQVGVKNDKVVSIYVIGDDIEIAPFEINQPVEEIYQSTLLGPEFALESEQGTYRFELSEEDLNIRPLVQLDNIYAQLMIDKYTSRLSSVRFYDKETLLIQRPYELFYRGELQHAIDEKEELWQEIEAANARQIFDITNVIRHRFGLKEVVWNDEIAEVAFNHSKDMAENKFFSHESELTGDLAQRLEEGGINYQTAAENIAADYVDGPAAVDGWLNSDGHRKTMLSEDFEELGVGVFKKYYTQNFFTSLE